MNYVESQTQILDELCYLMRISAEEDYSHMQCRFDYSSSEDGSSSVGSKFYYVTSKEKKSVALVYPERKKISDLIPKLHSLMKAHTGGDWSAFTITIDPEGKAKINFEYPENK